CRTCSSRRARGPRCPAPPPARRRRPGAPRRLEGVIGRRPSTQRLGRSRLCRTSEVPRQSAVGSWLAPVRPLVRSRPRRRPRAPGGYLVGRGNSLNISSLGRRGRKITYIGHPTYHPGGVVALLDITTHLTASRRQLGVRPVSRSRARPCSRSGPRCKSRYCRVGRGRECPRP